MSHVRLFACVLSAYLLSGAAPMARAQHRSDMEAQIAESRREADQRRSDAAFQAKMRADLERDLTRSLTPLFDRRRSGTSGLAGESSPEILGPSRSTLAARHISDLLERAEQHDDAAQVELGQCYYNGTDTTVDKPRAYRIWTMGTSAHGYFLAAKMKYAGDGVDEDTLQAYPLMNFAASHGDADAKAWLKAHPEPVRHLGEFPAMAAFQDDVFVTVGKHVQPVSPELVARLASEVARAGKDYSKLEKLKPLGPDMVRAGLALIYGVGVPVDLKTADTLLTTAGNLEVEGAVLASYWQVWAEATGFKGPISSVRDSGVAAPDNTLLGYLLAAAIQKNGDQTLRRGYLQIAADYGNTQALTDWAIMQLEGNGGDTDDSYGLHNLEKAAKAENRNAKYILGLLYDRGEHGVTLDRAKAQEYFRAAAKDGQKMAAARVETN